MMEINQGLLKIFVEALANFSSSIVNNCMNNREKSRESLGQALQELETCEENSNACITTSTESRETKQYNDYYDKWQELRKLEGSYRHKMSKRKIKEYDQLYKEINKKLVIYRNAFIFESDIRNAELAKYSYYYIEPEETEIQKSIDKLIKSPI